MIDGEVKIFNRVHAGVAPLCAKNRFLSDPIQEYEKLPAASLYEMDNTTDKSGQGSAPNENRCVITYQGEAVAEDRATCKKIMDAMDTSMAAMNFTRVGGQTMISLNNLQICRIVSRYEAKIDSDGNLYRA